jgi:hypothetical protein
VSNDRKPGGSGKPSIIQTFSYRKPRARATAIGHHRRCNYSAAFEHDTMMKFSIPRNTLVALPPQVAAYVDATNSFDLERLLATFAQDALVNDQLSATTVFFGLKLSGETLARLLALLNETVLCLRPLNLDLIDSAATREDCFNRPTPVSSCYQPFPSMESVT